MSNVLKKTFSKPLLSVRNLCIHFNIKGQGAVNKSIPFSFQEFPPSTAKKMRTNVHRILNQAGYLTGGRKWILQKVDISPEVLRYFSKKYLW